jgi:hypothetical protein
MSPLGVIEWHPWSSAAFPHLRPTGIQYDSRDPSLEARLTPKCVQVSEGSAVRCLNRILRILSGAKNSARNPQGAFVVPGKQRVGSFTLGL